MSIKLLIYIFTIPVLVVLTQDLQVFAGAVVSRYRKFWKKLPEVPAGIAQHSIHVEGNIKLQVYEHPADPTVPEQPYVLLFFPGGQSSTEEFSFVQQWAARIGIRSYSLGYRGYGTSDGWPKEKTFLRDSEYFARYIMESNNLHNKQILICGYSLGCMAAADVARVIEPRLVLMISPFVSVKTIVNDYVGAWAGWLVWSRLNLLSLVKRLNNTRVATICAELDPVVKPHHQNTLAEHMAPQLQVAHLQIPAATPKDAFLQGQVNFAEIVLQELQL